MKAPSGLPAVTQFCVLTKAMPATIKATTIATLMTTMTLLTLLNSRMPMTRRDEIATMMSIAGTLRTAPVRLQTPAAAS